MQFDIEEVKKTLLQEMLEKAQKIVDKIKSYSCIKNAFLEGTDIKIEFNEKVELEGQNVLLVFYRGGAIKKYNENKNIKEYIKIEAIGEF